MKRFSINISCFKYPKHVNWCLRVNNQPYPVTICYRTASQKYCAIYQFCGQQITDRLQYWLPASQETSFDEVPKLHPNYRLQIDQIVLRPRLTYLINDCWFSEGTKTKNTKDGTDHILVRDVSRLANWTATNLMPGEGFMQVVWDFRWTKKQY